ncbi:MAG: ABC-type branched-subunit amino acid transport system substrate-binding protein, partial [Polyangiales bacterium]
GERSLAVEAYDALIEEAAPEEDKVEVRGRISVLVREATVDELGVMRSALSRAGEAWPIVAVRSLREAYESGDLVTVRSVALELSDADVELEPELRAMTLRADRTGQADPRAIGAILPLSGRGREVGQLALQAMMLGASLPPGAPPGPDSPRVFFRDSAGDSTRAEAAVNDLVTVHRVTAIVGPPDTESSRAAARRAQELGVPYISLAPDFEMTAIGPNVFRFLPTFEEELSALVVASRSSGASRIAILRPANNFGQRAHQALTAVLEELGVTLAADVQYDPSATSFREPMTELRGQEFDALLIPDSAARIALIAPALAAAGLWSSADGSVPSRARDARAVRLLLPSVAFSSSAAMRSSHRYLQGAFVSRTYDTALGVASLEFATLFEAQYGRAPSLFAAVAFDALALALQASRQGGGAGRAATRSSLEGQRAAAPVTSLGGFSRERTPLRGPAVLMFQASELVRPPVAAGDR